jgi:hypothetical protein
MPLKPLDFIRPNEKLNKVGMITEISTWLRSDGTTQYTASVEWLGGSDGLKSAWWLEQELVVIDNLARLLSRELAHPFGNGKQYIDDCYPK